MSHSPFIESSGYQIHPHSDSDSFVLSVQEIRTETKKAIANKLALFEDTTARKERINKLMQLLPNSIKLESADSDTVRFLTEVASDKSRAQTVLEAIQKPLDFDYLADVDCSLFSELRKNLPVPEQLLALLPNTIQWSIPFPSSAWALVDVLIELGLADEVWERIPKPLPLFEKLSSGFLNILSRFRHQKKYIQEIVAILPPKLDLGSIHFSEYSFLSAIIDLEGVSEVLDRLPDGIDLVTLSHYGAELLIDLCNQHQKKTVISRLPKICNVNEISDAAFHLFSKIDTPRLVLEPRSNSKKISTKLSRVFSSLTKSIEKTNVQPLESISERVDLIVPQIIDFESISVNGARFLLENLSRKELYHRLPATLENTDLSQGAYYLLSQLMGPYFRSPIIEKLISDTLETIALSLRKPILPSELHDIYLKVGPYLHEIIDGFPIIPDSIRKLKSGWMKAELCKTESKSFVFIRTDGDSEKVILRTSNYGFEELWTYQRAYEVLPDFVTCHFYPELADQPTSGVKPKLNPLMKGVGFREVFAGASLGEYRHYSLPEPIRKSIDQQVKYIKLMLITHGINHNHDHSMNFNVRFLLSSPDDSEKNISFDLNAAIQVAVERGWNLTPIVTLRDWDMATITAK